MVLYKRKPVTFVRPPEIGDDIAKEVYYIEATREWFFSYEEYLQRMDYYKRQKFVCEITGNSCLTFFQALESEEREIAGVEKNFPVALKEHILRFLQFNRITRLDQLVDKVYLVFKNDYFPGETVFLKASVLNDGPDNNMRRRAIIKEKIQYSNPEDGMTTKYLVVRLSDERQAIVTNEQISRDRNHFTKWLIKTFIKLTMSRSHKVGAPWVVKDKFAKLYRISQEYPEDLKHFESSTPSGNVVYESNASPSPSIGDSDSVDSKAAAKKSSGDPQSSKIIRKKAASNLSARKKAELAARMLQDEIKTKYPVHHVPESLLSELGLEAEKATPQPNNQPTRKNMVEDFYLKFNLQHPRPKPKSFELPENSKYWNSGDDEDRETDVNEEESPEQVSENNDQSEDPVAIQEALACWIFLNIYHSVLKLDTFTFDDFMYAMSWNHDQFSKIGRCVLLDEIWCAVLGAIVSNELPGKKNLGDDDKIFGLQISLPPKTSFIIKDDVEDYDERGSESDNEQKVLQSEDEKESDSANDSTNENVKFPASGNGSTNLDSQSFKTKDGKLSDDGTGQNSKSSKSKFNHIDEGKSEDDENDGEDEDDDESMEESEEDEDREHNAYTVMNHRGIKWHERLRRRDFKDGNWQCILLGVLSLVEYVPAYADLIDEIYKALSPIDLDPTPNTVLNQFYDELDVNTRIKTLNILMELLTNGKIVRKYIEECLDYSTTLRRNRLDNIRDYKLLLESGQKVNDEIQEKVNDFINDNETGSKTKSKDKPNGKNKNKAAETTQQSQEPNKRKTKLDLHAQEMTEIEINLAEVDGSFKRLLDQKKDILTQLDNFKKKKRDIERKLNEIDCQRVKLLGKDRFFNRYWWFENNGLPTLHSGVDDEDNVEEDNHDEIDNDENDVLDETYLMGKLWIQGPSNEDLRINLNASLDETREYLKSIKQAGKGPEQEDRIKEEFDWDEKSNKKLEFNLKRIDFKLYPRQFRETVQRHYNLKLKEEGVALLSKDGSTEELIVDEFGGLVDSSVINRISPIQRKILEEMPDPLINGDVWRLFDLPEEITSLIELLNPWGNRESQLRKELINARDAIVSSMDARRKALSLFATDSEEKSDTINDNENTERELASKLGDRRRTRDASLSRKRQRTDTNGRRGYALDDSSSSDQGSDNRELSRVMEWVNSCAIDRFEKSLYEGGDKLKTRQRSRRR